MPELAFGQLGRDKLTRAVPVATVSNHHPTRVLGVGIAKPGPKALPSTRGPDQPPPAPECSMTINSPPKATHTVEPLTDSSATTREAHLGARVPDPFAPAPTDPPTPVRLPNLNDVDPLAVPA
jgi:hypothetical protein